MNEKIMKLSEQAIEDMPGAWNIPDEFCKKFAELIVRECVEQIITGVRTNPPQPQPPELVQTLVRRIQRHFGVAE